MDARGRVYDCPSRVAAVVMRQHTTGPIVDRLEASAFRVPTEQPESDGTLEWDSTTIVVVEITAGDVAGLGYTYGSAAIATMIRSDLADVVVGHAALDTDRSWHAMNAAVRNSSRRGLASYAIAAVDIALWDVKARFLGVSIGDLLGGGHREFPAYGSGGFTSLTVWQLQDQLQKWVGGGLTRVKMKVGTSPSQDPRRVEAARTAIGPDADLYVDANGAYTRTQALSLAQSFADNGVVWFEEPVSSEDIDGLRMVNCRVPPGIDVTAGEYATVLSDFRNLLDARAVGCMQADVTRCGGISGFVRVAALCEAHEVDVSTHAAPHVSTVAAAGARRIRHIEYFTDHVRVEHLLFDGVTEPSHGILAPNTGAGLGLTFRRQDAAPYAV